ncbi:MAG: hypothetical protein RIT40_1320 [Planctomycetota bacterium]|jgi:hypothetical protein
MRKVQVVAQSARSCCIPRSMRCVLLSLLAVGLSSCFVARDSVNAPIEVRRYEQFVPGTTTAAEVVAAMGAPTDVVQLGRRSALRYDHADGKTAGFTLFVVTFVNRDTRSDRVWFFFDEENKLTHVGATLDAQGTEWAMPWQERTND